MNSNPKGDFGHKLKELRRRVGKSQIEVVEEIVKLFPGKIRMSQTTLSALEQRTTAPRGEILEILSKYFGVPTAYFFEGTENQEEKSLDVYEYLEALRLFTPNSNQRFAHSTEKRYNNDEIEQSL
ncbi:MAG: helix-turn-helix domain-containing protein, partial [Anaerolineae bacterium]|nr:helix-turn-helix domain-containing protein [Anaerolineae bacterium]